MSVGAGLYMYDVVVKSSRLLSHLLMSSCLLQISAVSQKRIHSHLLKIRPRCCNSCWL